MGLLSQGRPLDWDETKKYAKYVQERGITQFINIYNECKNRADGPFKWGDEIEYILVKFDHRNKVARVSLRAEEVFQRIDDQHKRNVGPPKSFWNPEYAAYMVEGTPGVPYGSDGNLLPGLCEVEENMKFRRQEVEKALAPDETVMSITSFPRLGCPGFTYPVSQAKPATSASGSIFFPDEAIYGGHPRFKTLTKNIRSRRRRKVIINLPIFRDLYTKDPFMEQFSDYEARRACKPNHVYMDAMGFGMGCCCLQITFQATHLEEAKVLYDQLAPVAPIALALSAGSPVFRGRLTDRDCRWDVISCASDDRTPEESGESERLKETMFRIPKSRYDSISTYLSRQGQKYNDIPLVLDKNYYDLMVANQVDPAVARHIAHLFIRDPITLYKEKLEQTDSEMDHFENIQSTNWQTMRFKPPPSVESPIGWRVEFRPLEAQTTDFENAAYVVFTILLTRVVLAYKLNFLLPLSLVDENMIEAQKRDAIKEAKFWFRRNIMQKSSSKEPLSTVLENCSNPTNTCNKPNFTPLSSNILMDHRTSNNKLSAQDIESYASKMTINEIVNGSDNFIGLLPIICHYVDSFDDGSNTELISKIHSYLRLISDRASLKIKTTAHYMRDFIDSHPKYAHDSIVNDDVAYDLLNTMDKIGKGELICSELTGFEIPQGSSTNDNMNLNFCVNCCMFQQRDLLGSNQISTSSTRSNNAASDSEVRKSVMNELNSSRKTLPHRTNNHNMDKTHTGNRSISR